MPPKYQIVLSDADFAWAKRIGLLRHARALAAGMKEAHGHNAGLSEGDHVIGCGGELAFCLFIAVRWPALVDTYKTCPDVPEAYAHIRTRTKNWLGIYHRADDERSGYWICVTVDETSRVYTIHGYIRGCDIRKIGIYQDLRNNREDVWIVDQPFLCDAAELRAKPLPEPPVDPDIGVLADDYPFQVAWHQEVK